MSAEVKAQAVLFDFDGVLFDTTASVERFWQEWADENGVDYAKVQEVMHGRQEYETVRMLKPEQGSSKADYYRKRPIHDYELEGVSVYEGVRGLLDALPEGKWAIVTSGHRELLEARLEHHGFPKPAVIVTAQDIENGKPAPDCYELGAERLGLAPGDCVVVEDSAPGIKAGVAAGCEVIAVLTTQGRDEVEGLDEKPSLVVDDAGKLDAAVLNGGIRLSTG